MDRRPDHWMVVRAVTVYLPLVRMVVAVAVYCPLDRMVVAVVAVVRPPWTGRWCAPPLVWAVAVYLRSQAHH